MASRGVARDTAIIIVMQRLHMEDLCAHLLARGGEWTHVCWPMRFAPERRDPLDPRTQPGELLWPALFTEEKVRRLELDLGPYGSASQLAQIPAPEGGGLFRREWFKFVDASPRQATRIRGWDTAGSEGKGDYTVGVKIAKVGGIWFVEDVVRGRWGPAGVDQVMRATAEADGRGCLQREEREGGASGKAMAAAHARLLVGYDYADVALGADKVTRARPFRAQCEAGNVYLVRGAWVEAFLQEIAEFPVGGHDDQVDAASCAFNAGLLEEKTLVDLTVGPSSVGGGRSYWQGPQ
jgi:predicted phage terminase large subunit-like protein